MYCQEGGIRLINNACQLSSNTGGVSSGRLLLFGSLPGGVRNSGRNKKGSHKLPCQCAGIYPALFRPAFPLKAFDIDCKHAMYGPGGGNFAIKFHYLKTNTLNAIIS